MTVLGVALQLMRPSSHPMAECDAMDHPSQTLPCSGNEQLTIRLDTKTDAIRTEASTPSKLLSLIECLKNNQDDVDMVLSAIRAIGQRGAASMPFADFLAARLHDRRVEVRRVAAWSLGQVGSAAAKQYAQDLAQCMEDSDWGLKWQCSQVLQLAGKEGAGFLAKAAFGNSGSSVALAEDSLRKHGLVGCEAAASYLADPNPVIRQRAASFMSQMHEVASPFVHPLMNLLGDSDVAVRQAAVEALGQIGAIVGENCVDALAQLLDDAHEGVRCSAIVALGQLAKLASNHKLKLCIVMHKGSAHMKRCAIHTLANIVAEHLPGDALLHFDGGAWTLPMDAHVAALCLLKHEANDARKTAAESLGLMGVQGATILASQLGSKIQTLREVCVETLMGMKPARPGALHIGAAAFASHLEGTNEDLRISVLGWLARIGRDAAPHSPTCYAVYTGNYDERTRKAALNAVCRMGTETESTNVLLRDPTIVMCANESTKESKESIRLAKAMWLAMLNLLETERKSASRSWATRLSQKARSVSSLLSSSRKPIRPSVLCLIMRLEVFHCLI